MRSSVTTVDYNSTTRSRLECLDNATASSQKQTTIITLISNIDSSLIQRPSSRQNPNTKNPKKQNKSVTVLQ